jgi:rhomboid protease GluP
VFERAVLRLTPGVYSTWILLALNVAVFIAMLASGASPLLPGTDVLLDFGANQGLRTISGEWWRITTANFVHIGVIHIAFNMYVLVAAGPLVERLLGNAPFMVMYLLAGALGSIASMSFQPMVVSAGASGAVFGVFGALLAIVIREKGSIPMARVTALRNNALGFVLLNVGFGFSMPGIDNAAHLGGLVGGFLAGAALCRPIVGEAKRSLTFKTLGVLILGGAILAGATQLMPSSLEDTMNFITVDGELRQEMHGHEKRFDAGDINGAELADLVDEQILPRWREASARLSRSDEASKKLRRYAALRFDALESLVRGLRNNDQDEIDWYIKKRDEAVQALE